MRFGLSSWAFPWAVGIPRFRPAEPMTPVSLIKIARAYGVGLVQLADNLPLTDASESDIAEIARAARSQRVALELGTRGIGPHLERYAELAVRLGSPFVRIVVDQGEDRPTPAQARARLAAYEPVFRSRGLKLAVENHDRYSASDLIDLVEALGDWAAICLDTVNSLGMLEPPAVVIERLGPYAIDLHLKDFTVHRAGHGLGFEVVGTPAGAGLLDLDLLLGSLHAQGRVETAVLELWTPPEPDLEATVAKERRWVQRSLDHLRTRPELEWG